MVSMDESTYCQQHPDPEVRAIFATIARVGAWWEEHKRQCDEMSLLAYGRKVDWSSPVHERPVTARDEIKLIRDQIEVGRKLCVQLKEQQDLDRYRHIAMVHGEDAADAWYMSTRTPEEVEAIEAKSTNMVRESQTAGLWIVGDGQPQNKKRTYAQVVSGDWPSSRKKTYAQILRGD